MTFNWEGGSSQYLFIDFKTFCMINLNIGSQKSHCINFFSEVLTCPSHRNLNSGYLERLPYLQASKETTNSFVFLFTLIRWIARAGNKNISILFSAFEEILKCINYPGSILYLKKLFIIDVNLAGLRRKQQKKDTFEPPPRPTDVVPLNMMNRPMKKSPPRGRSPARKRSRSRSPRSNTYSGSLSPRSRYEELYRRDDR